MYAYLSRVCGKDLDSFVLLERKSDRQGFNEKHAVGWVSTCIRIFIAIFNMTWAGFVTCLPI